MSDFDLNNLAYWYFEEMIKTVNTPDTTNAITIGPGVS